MEPRTENELLQGLTTKEILSWIRKLQRGYNEDNRHDEWLHILMRLFLNYSISILIPVYRRFPAHAKTCPHNTANLTVASCLSYVVSNLSGHFGQTSRIQVQKCVRFELRSLLV